ncbi:hypothetical protein CDAR_420741 [Caerostris darwini]|uniref:Uncharacterized protein n=1 Tax=Caerostris darwini TaxID=1538125 RepID=A0AAV4QYB5_9ARAC|nr:hypothetical protein CDAR_420741 [Caerostris darwini]
MSWNIDLCVSQRHLQELPAEIASDEAGQADKAAARRATAGMGQHPDETDCTADSAVLTEGDPVSFSATGAALAFPFGTASSDK